MTSLELTKRLNSESSNKVRAVQENRRKEALLLQKVGVVTANKKTKTK